MNRIEQVATPAPAQQPQPRFLRSPADVRRRASSARSQPTSTEAPARSRRRTSGLAVAIAALAVPLIPSPALGAVTSHGHVVPDPGALTVQAWATASGWTLTVPGRPVDAGLWDHVPAMRHDGGYVTRPVEVVAPIGHPRPVVLPDGTHGEISAYQVSRASPRADNPDSSGTQTPADPVGSDGSTSSAPSGDAPPEWSSGGPSAWRNARSRVVPGPLIPLGSPPHTMQMEGSPRQDADIPNGAVSRPSAPKQVVAVNAVATTSASPCLGAAYPTGDDRYMLARLRPVSDAMDVVVTPRRVACAARVDYLSQARA